MIYGAIILSFLVTLGFFLLNKTQYKWWEFFLGTAATGIVVLIFKLCFNAIGDSYTETWGSTIVSVYEEEPYNYWHSEMCSRTYACGSHTDSNGNTTTDYCTEWYDCSHQDDVGPHWYAKTDIDETLGISERQYDSLAYVFGGKRFIVNEHRNYSPRDKAVSSNGTKFQGKQVGQTSYEYRVDWPKNEATRKAVATQHRYTNKVKSSDLTIFNISLVKKEQADSMGLFNYPKLNDELTYPTIIGTKVSPKVNENFRKLNGKYGPTNQVRLWVLVYENKPSMIAKYQENYWVRGNMNELVVCIGKKDTTIQWVDVFSWTTNESLKIEIKDYIINQGSVTEKTWNNLYTYMDNQLKTYVRRDFAEFDYLKRRTKWWEILIAYVFGLAAAVGVNFWASTNEFNDDTPLLYNYKRTNKKEYKLKY